MSNPILLKRIQRRWATSVLLLCSVLAPSTTAQIPQEVSLQTFHDLTTTHDGSVLYFAAKFRSKGSSQSFHSKIYRWDQANGFALIAEEPEDSDPANCLPNVKYNELHTPQVSADGALLAYTASLPSLNHGKCDAPRELDQIIVQGPQLNWRADGNGTIASNGRYAITTPSQAVFGKYHLVTDLSSGQTNIVAGTFDGAIVRSTAEGDVVREEGSAVILTDRNGYTRTFPTKRYGTEVIIDQSGRRMVYLTPASPGSAAAITAIDSATGIETELATSLGLFPMSLNADGSRLLYYSYDSPTFRMFISSTDGGGIRRLTTDKTDFDVLRRGVISGDGRVAYGVTRDNRLMRVDIETGVIAELGSALSIGSAYLRTASQGFGTPSTSGSLPVGAMAEFALSGVQNGVQASLCGQPVSLVETLPGRIRFQVPWNTSEGSCILAVATDTPFETGIRVGIALSDLQFALVLHEDTTQGVSPPSPARIGERLTAIMSGLGPIDANGKVDEGFYCRFNFTPAEVLYAGVSDEIGFYRVTVKVPSLPAGLTPLTCGGHRDAFVPTAITNVWIAP